MRRKGLTTAALVLAATPAQASGFQVNDLDARATGRGGAVTASPSNASTIHFNPAGIAELKGWHAELGASVIVPSASFVQSSSGRETAAENRQFVLPQLYLAGEVTDELAVGIGVNTPYGLALTWPESSPGRTTVRTTELQTVFVSPGIAVQLSQWVEGLSLGAGVDLVPASVELGRDIAFGSDFAQVELGGTAFGIGGRAGVVYRPAALDGWSFGATYRTPVRLQFEGEGDFDSSNIYRAELPPDGPVSTEITLPSSLGAGIAFRPTPQWELEVDAQLTGWSSYDTLDVTLPNDEVLRSPKDWKDSVTIRAGGEVQFSPNWSARMGAVWEQSPVPSHTLDHLLPEGDRMDVTLGLGAQLSAAARLDVAGLYVLPKHRESSREARNSALEGQYRSQAWVLSATLGLKFGSGSQQPDPHSLKPLRSSPQVGGSSPKLRF